MRPREPRSEKRKIIRILIPMRRKWTRSRHFVQVVDAGSFSAVARLQGIRQLAVSKAVFQLEQLLGVSLLLRSTQSLVPTEAGLIFYEHAKRTTEEADEAVMAAQGNASGLSGKLRVSASICFGRLHVIPSLSGR
jgi:DNA-binding transcriptional LysR family regulator